MTEYWRIGGGPMTREQYLRHLLASGWTDEEIVDQETRHRTLTLRERHVLEAEIAAVHPAARARAIPDVEVAMRRAIDGLRRDRVRLTWPNVAARMVRDEPGLKDRGLSDRTLRRWATEDELPHPDRPFWKMSG